MNDLRGCEMVLDRALVEVDRLFFVHATLIVLHLMVDHIVLSFVDVKRCLTPQIAISTLDIVISESLLEAMEIGPSFCIMLLVHVEEVEVRVN